MVEEAEPELEDRRECRQVAARMVEVQAEAASMIQGSFAAGAAGAAADGVVAARASKEQVVLAYPEEKTGLALAGTLDLQELERNQNFLGETPARQA